MSQDDRQDDRPADPPRPAASYELRLDPDEDGEGGGAGARDAEAEAPRPRLPAEPPRHDDLEGYETSMARFARRFRVWLAALLAAALVVPLGGWLIDEIAYRVSGSQVEAEVDPAVVDAVLLVRAIGCDGRVSTGSAFVADVDGTPTVITNRHVVDGARTVSLRALEGGPSTAAAGTRLAVGADVAVVEVADPATLPEPLALGRAPEPQQEVRLVGFPAALPFTTAGTVEAVGQGQVLLDLRTDPGASGSPVVDLDDRVVAQVFARTEDGRGVATPVDVLAQAVATAEPAPPC